VTPFREQVELAAALAANPGDALSDIADELDALIETDHFTHYQHTRLTAMVWALRMVGETNKEQMG
jgi:hypothetical protein